MHGTHSLRLFLYTFDLHTIYYYVQGAEHSDNDNQQRKWTEAFVKK